MLPKTGTNISSKHIRPIIYIHIAKAKADVGYFISPKVGTIMFVNNVLYRYLWLIRLTVSAIGLQGKPTFYCIKQLLVSEKSSVIV